MTGRRGLWACLALLLAVGVPMPAAAQATDTGTEQAREAFRLGNGLAKQGQWAEALAAFQRSHSLRPHPTTMYNIGYCERALTRYTRARKAFLQALSEHASADGGQLSDSELEQLNGYLEEIDAKLVHLSVEVAEADIRVAVDGRPLEMSVDVARGISMVAGTRASAVGEPLPARRVQVVLDPGVRVLLLTHPDGRSRGMTVDLEPGESRALSLELGSPADGDEVRIGDLRPASWVAFGLAGSGLVAAVVGGALAVDTQARLDEICPTPTECPAEAAGDIDDLRVAGAVASVGATVAVAGVILATSLWLLSDEPEAHPDLVITPTGVGWRF